MPAPSRSAQTLLDGGIVMPGGYGKGMPIVSARGLAIMEALETLFADALWPDGRLLRHYPHLLVDYAAYAREVESFGGYENIYVLADAGRSGSVLRPDCAVENLRQLRRHRWRDGTPVAILACFQGIRQLHGQTIALFKDRIIRPFLQLNVIDRRGERALAWSGVLDRLATFFRLLGMPVVICDIGAWKNYSPQLYHAYTWLPDGSLTIVAMAYEVGPAYCAAAGLAEDDVAFDIGITQKVLSVLALQRGGPDGLALPSILLPYDVASADADWPVAALAGLRARHVASGQRDWWRREFRRGTPIALARGHAGWRSCRRGGRWQDASDHRPLLDVRRAHDDDSRRRALDLLAPFITASLSPQDAVRNVPVVRAVHATPDMTRAFLRLPEGPVY